MASIFDLFSNNNAQDAANAQIGGIRSGLTQAQGSINNGLNQATGSYTAGLQPFLNNVQTANQGTSALADLLGLNGPQGNANATKQLQNTPGYQFTLDQGTQNLLRNQAATGQLASGATNVDLQNFGQQTATAAAYQPYLEALKSYLPYSTQSAGGVGTLYSGLAGLQSNTGNTLGSLAYGANTSMGNATANADLANNAAAANQFGALKSGLGLLAQGGGFSGLGSGLGSLASGIGSGISSLGSSLLAFL